MKIDPLPNCFVEKTEPFLLTILHLESREELRTWLGSQPEAWRQGQKVRLPERVWSEQFEVAEGGGVVRKTQIPATPVDTTPAMGTEARNGAGAVRAASQLNRLRSRLRQEKTPLKSPNDPNHELKAALTGNTTRSR